MTGPRYACIYRYYIYLSESLSISITKGWELRDALNKCFCPINPALVEKDSNVVIWPALLEYSALDTTLDQIV